jgi:hypothetical protein
MAQKSKRSTAKGLSSSKREGKGQSASKPLPKLARLYPTLAVGPLPAQRRARLLSSLRQRGIPPIEDYDGYLDEVSDFWPAEESCDDFLAWLRRLRHEERT